MTQYAALLSSYSEACGGILGPHPSIGEAATAGKQTVTAQPGIRYMLLQREHDNDTWHGVYDGAGVAELIERMTT